jgi:hypothetical protein
MWLNTVQHFNAPLDFILKIDARLFWEDNWMDQPLQSVYPTLYQMSVQQKHTVHETNLMGAWQLLFRGLLSYQDQQQL